MERRVIAILQKLYNKGNFREKRPSQLSPAIQTGQQ